MDQHAIYMHNELVIMVGKGNAKKVNGIADLGRADVRTSMPNPINEGIMQFYARKVLEAVRAGAAVEGIALPPTDSLRDEVAYAIGALKGSPRADAAAKYLAFLATPVAQSAYSSYGFVSASADELKLKPIP